MSRNSLQKRYLKVNVIRDSESNAVPTCNHLNRKRTLNHLASLAKWLSVRLQTKWLWAQIPLLSPKTFQFKFVVLTEKNTLFINFFYHKIFQTFYMKTATHLGKGHPS